ncbi:hypothetical protein VOLCADRAFT_88277 [Volvox carteri f. nagariensis]|uniref:F-box domain-containing protein n=1 Tax=Volvox carteri f. nagariensis TaxID=3068 RepID=D8TNR9_VOLCA|nr:uncharacterized protein VOLCADRAFT_88277 [Volvox carteri f. nagariensis]EFJ51041.1 hypothetical protein VOLCADRAFT_88277 [Volvox carteri f. nagariensis]|eukprot:XP_002948053.1 hypothetical protein VOLCADRAFT_88277 [Volvox carteri f. nagariensis]
MSSSANRLQLLPGRFRGMAGEALHACSQQIATLMRNRRGFAFGASGVALFVVLGAIQRVRRRGRGGIGASTCGRQGRFARKSGASIEKQREPCPCPVLWEQIQQRDWLFGLPPQIADSILARLDAQDLKALRATCRQTYLQVAARTTKLVRALDASPRTWRLLACPRLDSIYPGLRELHLVMAGGAAGDGEADGEADGDAAGLRAQRVGGRRNGRAVTSPAAGATANKTRLMLPGSGSGGLCGGPPAREREDGTLPGCRGGPECLRDFVIWCGNGHLQGLTLLDLSRCEGVPIHRDTWVALLEALGPGEVTLRVDWRALLHHAAASGTAAAAAAASGSAGGSAAGRGGGGNSAAGAAAAAAKAKAAAAKAAGLLTSPMPPDGPSPPSLPPLPPPPPPPPRPAVLEQLCTISQLASVSLAVCGVRPLAHHAGWFSCLRRLHSLELRYREEPTGDVALHQIVRALQAPVPLRSLIVHRPTTHPLDEADLAALAQLPSLASLDAPGLRVHNPTSLVMTGLTRLALRSDRLELTQPLVALFPALEHLELGNGAVDLPPTPVLAAAASVAGGAAAAGGAGGGWRMLQRGQDAPAGPVAAAAAAAAEVMAAAPPPLAMLPGAVLADELVVPVAAAAAGASGHLRRGHLDQRVAQSLLPPELTLHLRLLQGLSGLRVLSIGGKPGHGVEALSSLTTLSALILVRCSEFRPLRKAVEELRGLTQLRSLELHACLGGDACGYEIARLLRRLQKLPNLSRLVVHGCDPRLPQQLATAPLGRLSELQLVGQPELQPLDLRYAVQAQTGCRRLVVRGCARLDRRMVEGLPVATGRPLLSVEWAPCEEVEEPAVLQSGNGLPCGCALMVCHRPTL